MRIGKTMSTYDKLYVLDFRQNLSQEAIDEFTKNKIIRNRVLVENVRKFKQLDSTWIQLTDATLNLPEKSVFNNLTHLSKIIIRGHGNAGLSFIESDEFGTEHIIQTNALKQYYKSVNLRLEAVKKELNVLRSSIDELAQQLQTLQEKRAIRRLQIKKNQHASDAEILDLYEQTKKKTIERNDLREKYKGKSPEGVVTQQELKELDRLNSLIENTTSTKKQLTVDQLAAFLFKQIQIIPPVTIGVINKSPLSIGEKTKGIKRRLTIQCAMCHGGEAKDDSPAFCSLLRENLAEKGLEVNVIGYLISTGFMINSKAVSESQLITFHNGQPVFESRFVGYKSTGMNVESKFKNKSTEDGKPGIDQSTKIIFNADYPTGRDYNIWKGENFTGNQGPMVDLLSEMQTEIWSAHWQNEGKTIFGSKVPDGIVRLRGLLPKEEALKLEEIDPQRVKQIWNSIKEVLANKVRTNNFFRKAVTADIYQQYYDAMKGY